MHLNSRRLVKTLMPQRSPGEDPQSRSPMTPESPQPCRSRSQNQNQNQNQSQSQSQRKPRNLKRQRQRRRQRHPRAEDGNQRKKNRHQMKRMQQKMRERHSNHGNRINAPSKPSWSCRALFPLLKFNSFTVD